MKKSADIVTTTFNSPLGLMRVAASPQGVCGVWFEGQRHQADASAWPTVPGHPLLQTVAGTLATAVRPAG